MNPSISGGTGLDNHYSVDGVNVTNQGYGAIGSYSIIFGSLGNATPYDFVREVQVKSGGYEAEFGQAIGGVVNVITKSGTNEFRSSVFGYSAPDALEGDWRRFQTLNGTVQTRHTEQQDFGFESGGPIVRDRLFYFAAVNPQWQTRTLEAPEGFPLFTLGDVDRERRSLPYSAKASYRFSPSHSIDASFFGDPSEGTLGPQRTSSLILTDTTSFSELTYGGHNQTVRYFGVMQPEWMIEASFARALNTIDELPAVNEWRVEDQTVSPNVITGGVGFFEAGNRSVNNQWELKSTHLLGDHEFKWGVHYDDVEYSQVNQRTGPTFTAPDGRQTATGAQVTILPDVNFGRIFRVTRANFNSGRVTTQNYVALFVQDLWRVSDRLTVTPGLRYEQQQLSGSIVEDFSLSNNWAPRIGVVFDATADGRTKLFGNFGRFYARMPNDLAARALSADDGISRADYFDAALTQPIPEGVVTQTPTGAAVTEHFIVAGAGASAIDPDAKMSYLDEVVAGLEREVAGNLSIGARYIRRNIGRVLEDVANVPMVAYDLDIPGVDSVEYILTNPSAETPLFPGTEFLGASFDDPKHLYQAVELTLNRRESDRWSFMGSYRYSRLRGNFEGFFREDNGQSDPGITSLYDFPTNDPSYATIGATQFGYRGDIRFLGEDGILPLDRPHQGKVFGNVFAGNWNIGLGMTVQSGKPLTPLAANPSYTNGGEIPEAPRGSGIETVDGFRTRTPVESQVDLQVGYTIGRGGRREVSLIGEVFNLFNQRTTLDYDTFTELEFGVPNPDFGSPTSQNVAGPQFQQPRFIRVGLRIRF
jgi:outer membrane receptor protein involved in Fe transport